MKILKTWSLLSLTLDSNAAIGCPFCHSDLSRLVRAGLWRSFQEEAHLLALSLPFFVSALFIFFFDRPSRARTSIQGEQHVRRN